MIWYFRRFRNYEQQEIPPPVLSARGEQALGSAIYSRKISATNKNRLSAKLLIDKLKANIDGDN